ncbi:RNA-binding motif protein 25 isoform X1 [Solanum lycopersicum]|uniref:RNA-binding motif protein 25 isoform X1 n=1 Tax=Solanum lycopersicum TaxID=4081 RepID=UPI0002BC9E0B|nr:RNA-binding protein 25 isoform X1 [Solanum lycopersicum]
MADSAPSPENSAVANSQPLTESDNKTSQSDPSPAPSLSSPLPPPPPLIQPYSGTPPSFRPATPPAPLPGVGVAPMFSPLPNPNLQQQTLNFPNPSVQPPGVNSVPPSMIPAPTAGAGAVQMGSAPQIMPPYAMPGQMVRPYAPMPNGYHAMPQPAPQGAMIHPGIPRYASPYTQMARPVFPPRPLGAVGIIPPLMRPPIPMMRPPIIPPVARPAAIPSITQTEKPQTTVYVGKISSTAENDFMLSLLQLCGPVRSWKRAQDPTNGSLKGFGFCEFESAEGVLRALRLLNKLNIDGQELMLNVNQATRDFLERYVEKKAENSKKPKESESEGTEKEGESALGGETNENPKTTAEPPESSTEESKQDSGDKGNKENLDAANFGLVTDEDRQADKEALEKLKDMIEERLKNKPLPPPPPPPQAPKDGSDNSYTEDLKDGEPGRDTAKNEEKNDDVNESKTSSEHDKAEISSPDHRRHDRRSRDRERDLKREKERELERYEREREQERAKREKEREYKTREDDRRYKSREKEWETREREREHWRKREREREKERAQERKWDIVEQERECEDGYRKRKHRTSDEERKRRQREKEDDLADRFKEEEEIAEAKRRADEEHQKKEQEEALKILSGHLANGREKVISYEENNLDSQDKNIETAHFNLSQGEGVAQNGTDEESVRAVTATSDMRHNSNAPTKRLEFGLSGSGKRAAVPSFFNADEDEDTQKEKKMRPLVPIDYSADEHMVQPSISVASPTMAAEFAKRISNVNAKEERPDIEKERHRRTHDRSSQRDRDRHDEETNRTRDDGRNLDHGRVRETRPDKVKTPDNQKLLDAKQLIDMIPKTKDELFSYEINWATYDKNALHERMRPWISKKITDFLGEEEPTLVDYIVSSTQEHVKATEMLERLQSILDEEAEMFVLKMWRMLIFEIKKVETGLALRPKS